jgi:hypothetical protein
LAGAAAVFFALGAAAFGFATRARATTGFAAAFLGAAFFGAAFFGAAFFGTTFFTAALAATAGAFFGADLVVVRAIWTFLQVERLGDDLSKQKIPQTK